VSRLLGGECYVEISREVPIADAARVNYQVAIQWTHCLEEDHHAALLAATRQQVDPL